MVSWERDPHTQGVNLRVSEGEMREEPASRFVHTVPARPSGREGSGTACFAFRALSSGLRILPPDPRRSAD